MPQDMTMGTHWESRADVVAYLASQLNKGRLSIFLGSGVSYAQGLPDWDGLLQRLSDKATISFPPRGYPSSPTPLMVATSLRSKYSNTTEFKAAVKECLYAGARVEFADLAANKTFAALGSLVMASSRGGVASVITLNFDDCLESYLESAGFVVASVSSPSYWATRADISIFHPHGFLPHDLDRIDSDEIVLDQVSFTAATNARDSPWYQKLVPILRNSTVILLGVGDSDQNLFAMLKNAQVEHPIANEKVLFNGILFKDKLICESIETFKKFGICTFPVVDYLDDMPNLLFEVCQLASSNRRSQLGI